MTATPWWAGRDRARDFDRLNTRGGATERQFLLFSCGCVRQFWDLTPAGGASRAAVETAERFVDGLATGPDREAANAAAWRCSQTFSGSDPGLMVALAAAYACWVDEDYGPAHGADTVRLYLRDAVRLTALRDPGRDPAEAWRRHDALIDAIFYDVMGSCLYPVALEPRWVAWNNGFAARVAREMYADRCFDRMPVLGDILEDAGCADEFVLAHCRQPTAHVRGCWLIDHILRAGHATI